MGFLERTALALGLLVRAPLGTTGPWILTSLAVEPLIALSDRSLLLFLPCALAACFAAALATSVALMTLDAASREAPLTSLAIAKRLRISLGRIAWLSIYNAVIAIGYLLFVIPGIVLTIRWGAIGPLSILQRVAPRDLRRESVAHMRGFGVQVVMALLAQGLILWVFESIARAFPFVYVPVFGSLKNVLEILVAAVLASAFTAFLFLCYLQARLRKEADLVINENALASETRAHGAPSV